MSEMSRWISKNCRKSEDGMTFTNVDLIFREYKQKRYMLIEEKTHNATQSGSYSQKIILGVLDNSLEKTLSAIGWKYDGFFIITTEGLTPDDGYTKISKPKRLARPVGENFLELTRNPFNKSWNYVFEFEKYVTKEELIRFLNDGTLPV